LKYLSEEACVLDHFSQVGVEVGCGLCDPFVVSVFVVGGYPVCVYSVVGGLVTATGNFGKKFSLIFICIVTIFGFFWGYTYCGLDVRFCLAVLMVWRMCFKKYYTHLIRQDVGGLWCFMDEGLISAT